MCVEGGDRRRSRRFAPAPFFVNTTPPPAAAATAAALHPISHHFIELVIMNSSWHHSHDDVTFHYRFVFSRVTQAGRQAGRYALDRRQFTPEPAADG